MDRILVKVWWCGARWPGHLDQSVFTNPIEHREPVDTKPHVWCRAMCQGHMYSRVCSESPRDLRDFCRSHQVTYTAFLLPCFFEHKWCSNHGERLRSQLLLNKDRYANVSVRGNTDLAGCLCDVHPPIYGMGRGVCKYSRTTYMQYMTRTVLDPFARPAPPSPLRTPSPMPPRPLRNVRNHPQLN